MPAFWAKAWKNSRKSSVSIEPIFSAGNADAPDEIGPAGNVERSAGQGLVHRQIGMSVARDAALIAQRLRDRLAKRNAAILDGVMLIDVQVALCLSEMSMRECRESCSSM